MLCGLLASSHCWKLILNRLLWTIVVQTISFSMDCLHWQVHSWYSFRELYLYTMVWLDIVVTCISCRCKKIRIHLCSWLWCRELFTPGILWGKGIVYKIYILSSVQNLVVKASIIGRPYLLSINCSNAFWWSFFKCKFSQIWVNAFWVQCQIYKLDSTA